MSLTESQAVFVSASESSLNDIVRAVVGARPHLLVYGSSAFVPASSAAETQMPPILFPGSGGIEWRVEFDVPVLDLFDEDVPLAPPLTLDKGQFSITTTLVLCVDCPEERRRGDDRHDPTRPNDGPNDGPNGRPNDHPNDRPDDAPKGPAQNPICCKLGVQAVGHLVDTWTASGLRALGFELDALELVDITPDELESVLECLIGQILRSVLRQVRLPLEAIRAGAFTLTPTEGPAIELDRVLARGTL